MPDVNEWLKRIHNDKSFAKKFEGIDDSKKIIALAKENGYEITEQDLNDIKMEAAAGGDKEGIDWRTVWNVLKGPGLDSIKRVLGINSDKKNKI